MRLKFELTNEDPAGEKSFTALTSMQVNRNSVEIRQYFSLEITFNIHEKGFTILKTNVKSEKYETLGVSKLHAGVRLGNSLVVRRVSPGRVTVVLF